MAWLKDHTLTELADIAGVSPSTVSRVINRKGGVSREAADRVMKVLQEFDVEPVEPIGKNLSLGKAIAVVIPDGKNPFFHTILFGVEEICRRHDYRIIYFGSQNDEDTEKANLAAILASHIPGLVLISQNPDDEILEKLTAAGKKIVLADRKVRGIRLPKVVTNNENGAYQATRYLLDLGHRSILYIGGNSKLSTEQSRVEGFKRAMSEAGLTLEPELVIEDSFDSDRAFDVVSRFFPEGLPCSAIFCADDMIAFGAKGAVEHYGLRVPDDISILGFDDISFARYMGLTTVAQPAVEIGRNAMLLLIDALENRLEEEDYTMVLEPSLVIRSTCGRSRTSADKVGAGGTAVIDHDA